MVRIQKFECYFSSALSGAQRGGGGGGSESLKMLVLRSIFHTPNLNGRGGARRRGGFMAPAAADGGGASEAQGSIFFVRFFGCTRGRILCSRCCAQRSAYAMTCAAFQLQNLSSCLHLAVWQQQSMEAHISCLLQRQGFLFLANYLISRAGGRAGRGHFSKRKDPGMD